MLKAKIVAAIRCDIDETKRYLQGKMSAEEAAAFEKNLETDPQFREEFAFNKDLLESMRIHYKSVLKDKLQSLEYSAEDSQKKGGQRRFFQITGMAAAIALVVAVGYGLFFTPSDPQGVFDQHFTPYYNVLGGTERSAGNVSGDLAMRLYEQQQYEEALVIFREAIRQHPDNTSLLFYKALSHLSVAQADSAIVDLNQVVNEPEGQLQEPARWYLGLAYLQKGDVRQAKEIFAIIKASADSYSERAGEILEALD
jgi:tetratricopeptide (TPR) repeat protein